MADSCRARVVLFPCTRLLRGLLYPFPFSIAIFFALRTRFECESGESGLLHVYSFGNGHSPAAARETLVAGGIPFRAHRTGQSSPALMATFTMLLCVACSLHHHVLGYLLRCMRSVFLYKRGDFLNHNVQVYMNASPLVSPRVRETRLLVHNCVQAPPTSGRGLDRETFMSRGTVTESV